MTITDPSSSAADVELCGGCAAKYPARRLAEILATIGGADDPALLVGLAPSDDAAVYQLAEHGLVFTLDFFPPIVERTGDFGAIAAANALSDVFAMGGIPLLALSIAVIPERFEQEIVRELFAAASAQVRAAGATLAGGHTLRGELLYGLAVIGSVDPTRVWTKAAARPGDRVYLTKRLGTGLLMHASRNGAVAAAQLDAAIVQMKELNLEPAAVLRELEPHAVTDVTGFGLLGHALEVAQRSEVRIELEAAAMPALDGARELAGVGVRSGGHSRNRDFVSDSLDCDGVAEADVALALDPQTSGGLLVTIAEDAAPVFEAAFARAGLGFHPVGRVHAGSGVALRHSC